MERFNSLLSSNELGQCFGNFKVIEASTKKFTESAKLKITKENCSEAELGYMLLPSYWGKGIGSEIAYLLINKAKNENYICFLLKFANTFFN